MSPSSISPLNLETLKTRGELLREQTRDVIAQSIQLRLYCQSLQSHIGQDLIGTGNKPCTSRVPVVLHNLTRREVEVVRLIVEGNSTKSIAHQLKIAFKTVAAHRGHIMNKLEVVNVAALVREAFRRGIVT